MMSLPRRIRAGSRALQGRHLHRTALGTVQVSNLLLSRKFYQHVIASSPFDFVTPRLGLLAMTDDSKIGQSHA
jgi:hypothetical protein